MIIQGSNIQLYSRHAALEQTSTRESLKAWVGKERPDFEKMEASGGSKLGKQIDFISISAEARARMLAKATAGSDGPQKTAETNTDGEVQLDPKTQMLKTIVEHMIGRKIRVLSLHDIQGDHGPQNLPACNPGKAADAPARQGWGVEYDSQVTTVEMETTSFSAQGVVQTADGKQIQFDLSLTMSRQFVSQESTSIRLGDAVMKDPLAINFNGAAAQLTSTQFSFDIDADGQQDQVSFAAPGSGFLAIDKNGDGAINNGSELFGPRTGNGFGELAAYDADKNNWIDEADAAFADLRIWSKDAQGNDVLSTLKEAGVGAIYLGNASTPFDVKDAQNSLMGQIQSSGVVLNEDGTVGTIQQVDLAATEQPVAEPSPDAQPPDPAADAPPATAPGTQPA